MTGQETLIYIDEKDQQDAGILAKKFTKEDVKNRAYFNALGALSVKKYLTSENIDISNTYNLHNICKILGEIDIADIMLPNIHIDVRLVFNEDYIFIPKSHFQLEILPDIYLVLLLSNDKSYVKFLGFFDPKLINKNNQNEEYYFIEKEKLTSPFNLKEFISNYNGNTAQELSGEQLENSDLMMISMIDDDIEIDSKKELLKNLTKSANLRDRFIEFENFELLAYSAEHSPDVIKPVANDLNMPIFNDDTSLSELEINNEILEIENTSEETNWDNLGDVAGSFASGMAGGIIAGGAIAGTGMAAAGAETISSAIDGIDTAASIAETAIDGVSNLAETAGEIISDNFDFIQNSDFSNNDESVEKDDNSGIEENLNEDFLNLDELEISTDETELNSESQEEFIEIQPNPDESATSNIDEISTIEEETVEIQDSEETPIFETENETENISDITMDFSSDLDLSELEESVEQEVYEVEETPEIKFDDVSELSENTVEETNSVYDDLSSNNLPSDDSENFEQMEESALDFDSIETLENSFEEDMQNSSLDFNTNEEEMDYDNTADESAVPKEPLVLRSSEETVNFDDFNMNPLQNSKSTNVVKEETLNFDDINLPEGLDLEETSAEELGLDVPDELEESETTDSEEIAELNLEAEDIGAVEAKSADEDIDIEDLKDIGIDLEELPASGEDISSNDLISQIDDLLSEEETKEEPGKEIYEETEESTYDDSQIVSEDDADFDEDEFLTDEDMAGAVDADNDKLEMLFSQNENHENVERLSNEDDELEEFDRSEEVYNQTMKPEQGKKGILVAAAVVALLAVTAGAGLFMLKNKGAGNNIAQNPAENELPAAAPTDVEQVPANNLTPDAPVDNTNLMTNAPDINKLPASNPNTANTNKELKNTEPQQKAKTSKPAAASAYMSVNKVMWEVPDYLSYSDKIKEYLQTAGKSIKLTLNSDLLLATEYAYSNQVKVELKLRNDGSVVNAQIVKSSGSNEINDIVLRTVKDTLNVVKPASGEVPTPDFKLGLIIYF